jgi:beta-glucosidase
VNAKGLEFYDKLVDELLAAGIEPWVTLFHWDLPYELYCRGHWLNPDIANWFADYTQVIVAKLSDRVSRWMTLNEPQCFIGLGLQNGAHAPGLKHNLPEVLRAAHHAMVAHGRAVQVLRAEAKLPASIGWAPVGVASMPATDSTADIEAARTATFTVKKDWCDLWNNSWWADPVIFGKYPEDGLEVFGSAVPAYTDDEMKIISEPIDFYGVNVYQGSYVRAGEDGRPKGVRRPLGSPITAFKWGVTPEALYWAPKFIQERYKLPIVVTENGLSCADWVSLDGKCHDPQRIDFLQRYLLELGRAIRDGVDVRGYFQWSIMDNFEWAEGYKERFGLVHVDYETQKRTLKDSAYWYGDVIASNGETLNPPPKV